MLNEGTIYNQLLGPWVLDIGNLKRDLRHHDLRVSLLAHEGGPGVVLEDYDVLLCDEWNVMFFGCGKIM